jgi:hypothetical protein
LFVAPPPFLRRPTCGNASLEALRDNWGTLDPAFLENSEFRPFWKFAFEFNREGASQQGAEVETLRSCISVESCLGTKKFLDRDAAVALLPLCIENRSKHSKQFVSFLESKAEDFKLNRDQWRGDRVSRKNAFVAKTSENAPEDPPPSQSGPAKGNKRVGVRFWIFQSPSAPFDHPRPRQTPEQGNAQSVETRLWRGALEATAPPLRSSHRIVF